MTAPRNAESDRDQLARVHSALDELDAAGINHIAFAAAHKPLIWPLPGPPCVGDGILLLTALGRGFSEHIQPGSSRGANPFDERSLTLSRAFIAGVGPTLGPAPITVYPGPHSIDLRACLSRARAQYPSPLGTGIRPDCGPWLAVRAAIACRPTQALLAEVLRRHPPLPEGASPCTSCRDQPCVQACPARALTGARRPHTNLGACVEHRVAPESSCATRCLAREACPIGRDVRYSQATIAYHYGISLTMIKDWRRSSSDG